MDTFLTVGCTTVSSVTDAVIQTIWRLFSALKQLLYLQFVQTCRQIGNSLSEEGA